MPQGNLATLPGTSRVAGTSVPLEVAILDSSGSHISSFGGSGGTAIADDAAFTVGSTNVTPAGGTYRVTRDAVDDGDAGALAMTAKRALVVCLETPLADSAMDDTNDAVRVNVVAGATAGTEYTEGDTDSTISGGAILWENTGNTLATVSAATPLPVGDAGGSLTVDVGTALPAGANAIGKLAANSGVDIGDVDVTTVGTITPGFAATSLGKREDDVHASNDVGVMGLAVRKNAAASTSGTDGDYQPLITNTTGHLWVDASGQTLTVAGFDVDINTLQSAATANGDGSSLDTHGCAAVGVVLDMTGAAGGTTVNFEGTIDLTNYVALIGYRVGTTPPTYSATVATAGITHWMVPVAGFPFFRCRISAYSAGTISATASRQSFDYPISSVQPISDAAGSLTVDNGGTFVVQENGAALTSLQLIDDVVYVDDTATHSTGVSKGVLVMGTATPTDTAVNANDIGALAMTLNRELLVQVNTALPAGANAIGKLAANSGVTIGAVEIAAAQTLATVTTVSTVTNVATIGTSVTPGTAAANLGKLEDGAHTTGDVGVMALGVRKATAAADLSAGATDGDYEPFQVDAAGNLWTHPYDTVAHDAADAGNGLKITAKAKTSPKGLTLVSDADRTDLLADADGMLMVKINTSGGDIVSERVSNTDGASTAFTNFSAVAGTKNYITGGHVFRTDAATGAAYVDFRDGATGSILYSMALPPNGGSVLPSAATPYFKTSAATALAYDVSAALTTVYISLSGFQSKV